MIEPAPSFPEIVHGTPDDAQFIIGWLKEEWDAGGGYSGFWGNRGMIEEAASKGDLWVIRRGGEAIAFQVGDYAADIVEVRQDYRGAGFGRMFYDASEERAYRDDVPVLAGQCAPESSLPFWLHMGFQQYQRSDRPRDVFVRKVLPRAFALPDDAKRVAVKISFLPEEAQYYQRKGAVPAISVHQVEGAVLPNGDVALARRVLALRDEEPAGRDLTIQIEIDGQEAYFGKAKYGDAVSAGVINHWRSDSFYIDRVTFSPNDEEG